MVNGQQPTVIAAMGCFERADETTSVLDAPEEGGVGPGCIRKMGSDSREALLVFNTPSRWSPSERSVAKMVGKRRDKVKANVVHHRLCHF
jgi:hypothetical protein